MIKINVITRNISWFKYIKNPNSYIDRKVSKINIKNKMLVGKSIYCTLLLSGEKEIKNLNKKFRKKNKSTDVLSFPFYPKKDLYKRLINEKEIYIGDIIINLNKINEKKKLKNFKKEFDNLWIHGLVHLFGHDHKKEKDYLIMSKLEKKYSRFINE
tara:strand:- start:112 stop:579 length:468 start_codon:yes stop_codon:yes gene_type:complete